MNVLTKSFATAIALEVMAVQTWCPAWPKTEDATGTVDDEWSAFDDRG